MENRKISSIRCIAIAILIAIASVFASKNAFAMNVANDPKFDCFLSNYQQQQTQEVDGVNTCTTAGTNINIQKLRIKDGSSWALNAKKGDIVQIVFNLRPNGTNNLVNYRLVNIDNSYNSAKLTDIDYQILNPTSQGYFDNPNKLNNLDTLRYYNWTQSSSLFKLKFKVLEDNPQIIVGSDARLLLETNSRNNEGMTLQILSINISNDDELDKSTINDNAQAEKQGRENIDNQDKSGDDYGTGNKQESLLNAIKRFGEALTYKKGSCSANIPAWKNISGGMTVDLCNTGVVMTGLSVILSVVAVFFFIPLAKSWLDTIIGLIREMQG